MAVQDPNAIKSDADARQQLRVREAALLCLHTLLTVDPDLVANNADRAKRATFYCNVAIAAFGTLPASVYKVIPEAGLRQVRRWVRQRPIRASMRLRHKIISLNLVAVPHQAAFACVAALPSAAYESMAAALVRIAADTLVQTYGIFADGGVPTTSLTRSLCNQHDGIVAGWTPAVDEAVLEDRVRALIPAGT